MTDDDFVTHLRALAATTPTVHVDHAKVLRAGRRRRTAHTAGTGVLIAMTLAATGAGLHAVTQTPHEQRPTVAAEPTPGPPATPLMPVWKPPQPQTVDGITALVAAEQPEGTAIVSWQAIVSGELVVLDGGCIGLQPGPDMPAELAIWPPGTTVLPGGDGIDLPGAGPIRLGQQIYHGGGHSNRDDAVPLSPAMDPCVFTEVASVNEVMPGDDIFTPPS